MHVHVHHVDGEAKFWVEPSSPLKKSSGALPRPEAPTLRRAILSESTWIRLRPPSLIRRIRVGIAHGALLQRTARIELAVNHGLDRRRLTRIEQLIRDHEHEIRTAWKAHFEA
jgi:hypothetical protein